MSAMQTLRAPLVTEKRPDSASPLVDPQCHAATHVAKLHPAQPWREAVEILLARYSQSTPMQRRRGRMWYPEMNRLLGAMADEHGRLKSQAIAVCSITSANTTLASNLKFTRQILAGERAAGCYPSFQAPLVEAVLKTRYPGRFVRGPKCTAFFQAIAGRTDALVLDRWAARAAGLNNPGRNDIYPAARRQLDIAYREAAKICCETVRAFQAITWIVVRESTPNKRGVIPQLLDISTLREAP